MRIALVQHDVAAGNLARNRDAILTVLQQIHRAAQQVDLVIFPELCLTGYPPHDDVLRYAVHPAMQQTLQQIRAATVDWSFHVVLGYPHLAWAGEQDLPQGGYLEPNRCTLLNRAVVSHQGEIVCHYDKQALPHDQVFDEPRYFATGQQNAVFMLAGQTIQLAICEDIWRADSQLAQQSADWLLILNASPYHMGKPAARDAYLAELARQQQKHLLYLNRVGAQDELVFDGGSRIFDRQGTGQAVWGGGTGIAIA